MSLGGVGIASYSVTFSKMPRVEGADSDAFFHISRIIINKKDHGQLEENALSHSAPANGSYVGI